MKPLQTVAMIEPKVHEMNRALLDWFTHGPRRRIRAKRSLRKVLSQTRLGPRKSNWHPQKNGWFPLGFPLKPSKRAPSQNRAICFLWFPMRQKTPKIKRVTTQVKTPPNVKMRMDFAFPGELRARPTAAAASGQRPRPVDVYRKIGTAERLEGFLKPFGFELCPVFSHSGH